MTTVTRADIAETICAEIGLSRKDAGDILDMVIDEIKGELISGKDVKISSFGSFLLKRKNARIGRNPKTGETVALAGKYVPHFKPGKDLRERVNEPDGSEDEDDDDDTSPPRPVPSASPSTVD